MNTGHNSCKVTILATSDLHGSVMPWSYADHSLQQSGLAKLATLIHSVRSSNPNTLLIDNGDLIQGTPLSYVHARIERDSIHPLVKCMNTLQYDAGVIGNHEFNYGLDVLRDVVKQSSFPWLSANTVNKQDNRPSFGPPYIVKTFANHIRVGIVGLTTQYVPLWELPSHIEGLEFKDAVETAQRWVQHLREQEQVDIVVAAYHGGFERDIVTGELTEEDTGENQGFQLCKQIKGIDVLITGHQHRKLAAEVHGVSVVQPGMQGSHLAQVDLELEQSSEGWRVVDKRFELLSVDGVCADLDIIELMRPYEIKTQRWLDKPIGTLNGDMRILDAMQARIEEHPLIEFIHTVQMHYGGTCISCTSLFDSSSPGFSTNITMREVVSNYIYPNTLRVIRITGQNMKDALEQSARYFKLTDDGEITVNDSFLYPKPQHYNYDMWEGIEYELDISRPEGQRVTRLDVEGSPVQMEAHYDVAMNNYRAGGGGSYPMFVGKPIVRDIPTEMAELIVTYIMERGTIEGGVNNNWRVVNKRVDTTDKA
ncbi:bifunctional metallophosphatase/5'-nucleotidase [Paenibacillus agilis]|uniref:Bifunctional metallophosphatase/5'-nucleotidase n=1 Tax=Paenibacillus agilis TaxID=3020863 RepID=A0A559IWC4_9BACL|nr:bifunctional UDP-sugar hydrolase/5'-nucleotidase [Paenibacillus agilis]TVX91924.1 bifunctional metallophosphatase/5'-nucleotidase [Paenibacillus agilis]